MTRTSRAAAATAASTEAPGASASPGVYGSKRRSIALSASWIAACRIARVRDCAIGFVPCDGVNASVATVFQCVTALPRACARRERRRLRGPDRGMASDDRDADERQRSSRAAGRDGGDRDG